MYLPIRLFSINKKMKIKGLYLIIKFCFKKNVKKNIEINKFFLNCVKFTH